MCGIAGIVALRGGQLVPSGAVRRMADAIAHRGPDAEGYFEDEGLALASRRLAILDVAGGHQPMASEDGSAVAVFNGELFDYPEVRRLLEAKGHRFATRCDTELVPHLWQAYGGAMVDHLHGQFALAVWDRRQRHLLLARDQFGICPLYWTRSRWNGGDWLLFASEIKALLASGFVTPRPDLRGLDQVFHFLAVPGPATCFEGITLLQPGHTLTLDLGRRDATAALRLRRYWALDFPERGHEDPGGEHLVDELERALVTAVERRLRADVPVVSYLSGGVDSSIVAAIAARVRGEAVPAFTVQIRTPGMDESKPAAVVGRHLGTEPIVVPVADADLLATYPELIRAAEAPVIDTSAAANVLLAREVHRRGYKVALTGEGSDEWLAGYSWYKVHRLFGMADVIPGLPLGHPLRRLLHRVVGASPAATERIERMRASLGHHSAFHDFYSLLAVARGRFLAPATLAALDDHNPYLELGPDLARMRRWDPLNQGLFWAARIHLAGHLLSLKGDRVAMNSAVETRYPFLDEDVVALLARVHPRWKLRGFRDKYLLRRVAARYLPRAIAWRRKKMFRARLDNFFAGPAPRFVEQLLSEPSLAKTGWFDAEQVRIWWGRLRRGGVPVYQRNIVELGMVGVVTSQLWYHTFIDGSLADLPSGWQRPARDTVCEPVAR
ncbi:MAG TPA: asparagine synthase (glutamine-hydrolyzing) [Methylomirabilota bacterium]|nr:asparagine synthase (glutamine-hydrolyzing) [Methylomirabilota bacterium]